MTNSGLPSFSIVIETDNLAVVSLGELFACLDSISAQGALLQQADTIVMADGGVVPEKTLRVLNDRYPWLAVLRAPKGASYIELKHAGAFKSDSEVILFCDGDVRYEPGWLMALLNGFQSRPDADVIAGETTTPISGVFSLAFALTFNFPRLTNERELAPTTTYWANNCAARRSTIARIPLPDPGELYRGQNLVHTMRLLQNEAVILRQPRARGWHAVIPPSKILQRYYRLGRDASSVRAITAQESGQAYLGAMSPDRPGLGVVGRLSDRLRQLAHSEPKWLILLPFSLPVIAAMGLAYMKGRIEARN